MLSKPKPSGQLSFFNSLANQIDSKHPLVLLAHRLNWSILEDSFAKHYSTKMGKPAKPIRLMVSLLILKQLRNLSDENIVSARSENLYFQYFSGQENFSSKAP